MAGEGEARNDVTSVKAESLRFAEFPHRVPNESFHTPAPHTVAGHPSKNFPPVEHNRCADGACASITHCLSSHSLLTVCGPAEKSKMMHREKTTIISCLANKLCTVHGKGNLSYIALFFTVKEVNWVLIQRQTIGPTTRSYIKPIH